MNLNRRVNNTDAVLLCITTSDQRYFSSRSIAKTIKKKKILGENNVLNVYQIADGLRQLQREGKIEKYNKHNWILISSKNDCNNNTTCLPEQTNTQNSIL